MTNYSRSVLKSNGLRHSKILPVKFGFSLKTVHANIAKKSLPQCCSKPLFIAFSTSRTNGPHSLSRMKSGTHATPAPNRAHSGLHAETGAFRTEGAITTLGAFRTFTNIPGPGIRTANFAAFWSWLGVLQKDAESLRNSDALMRVAVPRRRGPAGLRDLFRFCRNCGLYALRSGPFRVCEARGSITTLSALYVLLKRRTAAC